MRLGTLIGFLAIVIALYILWRIKQVLLLAFAAVVFATAMNQLVKLLEKKLKLERKVAIAIAVTGVLIFIIGFVALVIPPFIDQFQQLVTLVPLGLEQLSSWNEWLRNLLPDNLIEEVRGLESLTQNIQSYMDRFIGNFFDLFSSTLGVVLNSLLVIVVTIMLLSNPTPYKQMFLLMFPAFYRQRVQTIVKKCESNLGGWAIGILFNMAVIAIMSGIGLLILGVRLPLANSLLAGMLTFIPNLGPVLSVVPPAAMALLDAPWKALAVVILYVVIQQVESNVLTPIVMQKQVSLLPAVTLLSQVAFAVFFGLLGLFLALPITVVAQVWLKEVLVKDILDRWQIEDDINRFNTRKVGVKNREPNQRAFTAVSLTLPAPYKQMFLLMFPAFYRQ
ncbi:MAG: AI-2E family transporter, partial [Cyanobacteria bacterium J06648_1]